MTRPRCFLSCLKLIGCQTCLRETFATTWRTHCAPSSSEWQDDLSDFVIQLRRHMTDLRPAPAFSSHGKTNKFVFQDLKTCSHFFIRDYSGRKSLNPPYTGPHPVICCEEKTLTKYLSIEWSQLILCLKMTNQFPDQKVTDHLNLKRTLNHHWNTSPIQDVMFILKNLDIQSWVAYVASM